jgi:pyridoxamine 5'-phosphate oxidase family protein
MVREADVNFTPAERNYLGTQRLGRLATVDRNGLPQNNPVGFEYNPKTGTIDIHGFNLGATRKFRNVAANGRVAFVVDDIASLQPWKVRGIEIRGWADALVEQTPSRNYFSPEVIRIHPEQIFSWGIEPNTEGMRKRTVSTEATG